VCNFVGSANWQGDLRNPTFIQVVHVSNEVSERSTVVSRMLEQHHKTRLQAQFPNQLHCPIKVLDIPDNYQYMDPELIQLLETSVRGILQL
jgi:predicted protein tyrosine phosphatase